MLSPEGFPAGQPLIYNQHNFNQTDGEVQDFVDRTMASDLGTLWSELKPVETNLTSHFYD
jgi:hypothetical protein